MLEEDCLLRNKTIILTAYQIGKIERIVNSKLQGKKKSLRTKVFYISLNIDVIG